MRLKSLEIQGFKSFAHKSVYEFDRGVTAIVGPNGSGKSNIADAIRWVLGEQSYTNLRAQKTVDMIFSGSNNRARLGMAYVSLVLDNSDGSLPLDYNEVTIARRAFRSGENEYLINNNRVRLKDVTEILARGGLARQTYTLVGQGTIDRALSLRADERRQLFEEAAGTTYHRQRRAETLRRLDTTHQNLLRVNDIVKEIEPRLKRLERQVTKVEENQKIKRHLDGLLKIWYGYLWKEGQQNLHHARVRNTISQERLAEEQENLNQTELKIEQLREKQTHLRNQLGDWHAKSSRHHAQAEVLQRELAVGEERTRQLVAQREEFMKEIEQLKETCLHQQNQVNEAQAALVNIGQTYKEAKKRLQVVVQKLAQYETERNQFQQQQRAAEKEARQAAHSQTDRQSRLAHLAERQKDLQAQQKEQSQTIKSLQTQAVELGQNLTTTQEKLANLETDRQTLQNEQEDKARQGKVLLTQAKTLTIDLAEKEKSLASLQARQDLLAKLRTDMSGYHSGVKAVLQKKSLPGIRGTVAQLLKVPVHLEAALEAAIGGRLQDIIVDSWPDADTAIQHLKRTKAGRATFLPLSTLRPPSPLEIPQIKGVIGLGTDLVKFDPDIAPAAESLLNRLLIVEDLVAAKAAFDTMRGGFQITTQAGEIVRSGGSVTGGQSNRQHQGGNFLAREREWRELPKQIAAIQTTIADLQSKLDQNSIAQTELETALAACQQEQGKITDHINQTQKEINGQITRLTETKNQMSWQETLQAKVKQDIEANQAQQAACQADIARFAQQQKAAEKQAAALQIKIAGLSTEALNAEHNQAQSQVTIIQEKEQHQQTLLQNFRDNLAQTQARLDQRQARVKTLTEQRETLQTQLDTKSKDHSEILNILKSYTDKVKPAESELKILEKEHLTLEKQESKQRNQVRRLAGEANRFSLDLARQQDKMNDLQRQIEDDFGLVQLHLSDDQIGQPVLPIQSMVTQLPIVEELPEGIDEDIRHLKIQLRQLGNINPDAPREHAELKDRYTFLTSQMADLEDAASGLKAVIDELDTIMETSFKETYLQVAKAFQAYFKLLFNGGEAQLILTDPDNITETGIDIVARPPGKRAQNLELFSGGERSLTAQALIFALLKTSPTPYVIFDEVDAMLDEANVDRFRKALLALSQDIQFIVITHNRKTIEVAQTIYGIFMREDAVSEEVSLKLDDFSPSETDQLAFPFEADGKSHIQQ